MNILLENSKHLKYYGFMTDIFDVLDGICEKYDWYISDIETNCKPPDEINKSQVFIEGNKLKKLVYENEIQFVWAVFSALPKGIRPLVKEAPFADGNSSFWEGSPKPQLNGAAFEIVCWDTSLFLLIGVSDIIARSFMSKFSDAVDLDKYNKNKG